MSVHGLVGQFVALVIRTGAKLVQIGQWTAAILYISLQSPLHLLLPLSYLLSPIFPVVPSLSPTSLGMVNLCLICLTLIFNNSLLVFFRRGERERNIALDWELN